MDFKKKKILITAGPTWVPIDEVRVISNIASGKTGLLLARQAKKLGADVTLLMGPTENTIINNCIKVKPFKYFDDFKETFTREINKNYSVLIHSAAVSDYQPKKSSSGKIKSDFKRLSLDLILTPKLADRVKKINSKIFLVLFKLELNVPKAALIARAFKLLKATEADLVVANTFKGNNYNAYIVDRDKKIIGQAKNKNQLTKLLLKRIDERL
ncbi:MAG: phosphopantothenoylcysteine decarboxylase [Candidatus Omnitrophica bacterium]|nr:phosphopantothenoylcysteine decarboxylase [Candidatus Omnitrophota bacterium]HOX54549.1 phosphopantothenoylcysteine decarboxylase [Candidatus Omnitrophota bacterium]